MATFRAVENRVFVTRAANTGITGFIDPRGKILKGGGIFTEESMNGTIRLSENKTFYTLYGDVFAWCCSVLSIFLIAYALFQKSKNIKLKGKRR
jgi:apolipoprotein N-acyltransferase